MVKQSDRDCLEFISNCTFYLHLRVDNELHSQFLFDIKWTSINWMPSFLNQIINTVNVLSVSRNLHYDKNGYN